MPVGVRVKCHQKWPACQGFVSTVDMGALTLLPAVSLKVRRRCPSAISMKLRRRYPCRGRGVNAAIFSGALLECGTTID